MTPRGQPDGPARSAVSLGVIVPSVNMVAAGDLGRFLPGAVSWRVAKWETGKAHRPVPDVLAEIADIAAAAAASGADIIGFGCTAASVVGGPAGSRQIADAIKQRTGVAAVTTGAALAEAAGALGLENILFCSPFDEDYDRPEIDGLRSFGVPVTSSASLGLESARECVALTPGQIARWVSRADHPGADAVILSCANIRAFEAVASLEYLLAKPVISSNQALMWAMGRRLGQHWRPPRAGRLFEQDHGSGIDQV